MRIVLFFLFIPLLRQVQKEDSGDNYSSIFVMIIIITGIIKRFNFYCINYVI